MTTAAEISAKYGGNVGSYATHLTDAVHWTNVKNFGAKGDGVADDTTAINNAILHVKAEGGGVVYFPSGEYKVSSAITLDAPYITLMGAPCPMGYALASVKLSIIKCTHTSGDVITVKSKSCMVQDLGIDGNNNKLNGIHFGISYTDVANIGVVYRCAITTCKKGIFAENSSGIAVFERNQIHLCETGISMNQTGDSQIVGNYIVSCFVDDTASTDLAYGAAIYLRYGSGNINISGGKIEYNKRGIVIWNTMGVNITGVQFDVNRRASIHIEQDNAYIGAGEYKTRSITINGCRFLSGSDAHIKGLYASEIDIIGNTFAKGGEGAWDNNTGPNNGPSKGINLVNCPWFVIVGNDFFESAVDISVELFANDGSMGVFEGNGGISGNSVILPYVMNYMGTNRVTYGNAAPTTGTWNVGDERINTVPTPGGYTGWRCTTGGTPGTWKGYGLIQT